MKQEKISTKFAFSSILAAIAILLVLAASYINHNLEESYRATVRAETQAQLDSYQSRIGINLQNLIQSIKGLPGLFSIAPHLSQAEFAKAVAPLVDSESQIRNIAAAPDMVIRYMYPIDGNEAAIGLDYRHTPSQFEAADRARKTGKMVIAGPLQLKQGGVGLITRIPVTIHDEVTGLEYFWGIISTVIDIDRFFETNGLNGTLPIRLAIRGKDGKGVRGEVFYGDPALFNEQNLTRTLSLPEGEWQFAAEPIEGWGHLPDAFWQIKMLVYGGAMTLFLLLAVMIRFVFAAAMANHRFIQLIEQAPIPYLLLDGYKQVRFTNPAFTESYGYTWDDLTSMSSWWQITSLPKTNIELFQEHIKELQVGRSFSQSAIPFEVELKTRSGQSKFALITASFISNSLENEMLLVVYDITSRKEAEEQLRFSSRVFNQAHEGILITDTQGIITDSNPAFSDITGFEREEIIGRKPNLFRSGRHSENFYQDMWHSLNEHGYWYGEVWNLRKDNQIYAALLTISALKDDDGTTRHYVGLYTDITQAKRQQDELELLAHYDVLTKLPNRALFADRFVQAVAFSRRHDKMVGICFLDLDNFKPVNDRYGHDVGDYVLIEVAKRLKTIIRDEDTISRLGGDEFVILFCEIESKTQCEALMDRIHSALSEPYQYEDKEFSISASSGVTFYPEDDADLDTLLRHADHAMYQSKLLGRNTFTFFNPEEDEAKVEKVRELQQLQEALKADQFVLYYQPKVNMASGEVFGMEALIRWQHPERGVLTPYHFLPLMSDTYLEPHFGVWVMQQAVAQAHVWHQQGHKLEVSINISSYHLKSETFISDLAAVLAAYPDFEPQYLQLEILETSALGNVYEISDIIKQCRETLGVSIALDDFGTGYSALSHLRHLTASTVKIDQSFVRDMLDDPQDYNIVDGVTKLAKAFDIGVIAEGVETIEHGLLLLMTGCQLAQGYVIARPMPADEVATWIQHYRPLLRWMEASHDVTSPQQRIIIIFELIAQRLFNQVAEIILSERELPPTWPHFTSNNCPCYLWLERVRGMEIFDRAWIDKLAILHSQWMTEATAVKVAFESGQTDQENFERFQQAYEALSGLLSSAKSSWKHSSYPSIASSVNDEPL